MAVASYSGRRYFFGIFLLWFDSITAFVLTIVLAIAWEVFEFSTQDVEKIYGSKERYFMDAAGDIIGTAIAALIIVVIF